MCLDFYTLDVRECRAKRGARRERTNITKTGKMQSIFPERVSANGVPKKREAFFWGENQYIKSNSMS